MFKSVSGSDFILCFCNLPSLFAASTCTEELHNTQKLLGVIEIRLSLVDSCKSVSCCTAEL